MIRDLDWRVVVCHSHLIIHKHVAFDHCIDHLKNVASKMLYRSHYLSVGKHLCLRGGIALSDEIPRKLSKDHGATKEWCRPLLVAKPGSRSNQSAAGSPW